MCVCVGTYSRCVCVCVCVWVHSVGGRVCFILQSHVGHIVYVPG